MTHAESIAIEHIAYRPRYPRYPQAMRPKSVMPCGCERAKNTLELARPRRIAVLPGPLTASMRTHADG